MKHYDSTDGGDANVFDGALTVRTGDGSESHINPAIVPYVWHPNSIAEGVRLSIDELRLLRPEAVALHSGSADLLANLQRAYAALSLALDSQRRADLWVGLGIDGALGAWMQGKLNNSQVIKRYADVAALCEKLGAKVLVLNGESKWAIPEGSPRTSAQVKQLAHELGEAVRANAPSVIIGLSSFGRLGMHANVRALIEGLTPHCSLYTGQSYAARAGDVAKGVLPAVIAADEKSQKATERQGWHRPDVTTGEDPADDLDRSVVSVQGHKVDATDQCRLLCERAHVLVWAFPMLDEHGRVDAAGFEAMRAAVKIRLLVGRDVKEFQRQFGLKVDGAPGPLTRARALSLPW